jgi:CheY-like chemotaxis protein
MLERRFAAGGWSQRALQAVVFASDERKAASRARLLVVEDDPIVSLAMQRELEAFGYAVVASTDKGEDAVLLAETLEPDLVVMDVQLRGRMDGIAAAKAIRDRVGTPVLFVTAHAEGGTRAAIEAVAPAGIVRKPYSSDELDFAISIALQPFAPG